MRWWTQGVLHHHRLLDTVLCCVQQTMVVEVTRVGRCILSLGLIDHLLSGGRYQFLNCSARSHRPPRSRCRLNLLSCGGARNAPPLPRTCLAVPLQRVELDFCPASPCRRRRPRDLTPRRGLLRPVWRPLLPRPRPAVITLPVPFHPPPRPLPFLSTPVALASLLTVAPPPWRRLCRLLLAAPCCAPPTGGRPWCAPPPRLAWRWRSCKSRRRARRPLLPPPARRAVVTTTTMTGRPVGAVRRRPLLQAPPWRRRAHQRRQLPAAMARQPRRGAPHVAPRRRGGRVVVVVVPAVSGRRRRGGRVAHRGVTGVVPAAAARAGAPRRALPPAATGRAWRARSPTRLCPRGGCRLRRVPLVAVAAVVAVAPPLGIRANAGAPRGRLATTGARLASGLLGRWGASSTPPVPTARPPTS